MAAVVAAEARLAEVPPVAAAVLDPAAALCASLASQRPSDFCAKRKRPNAKRWPSSTRRLRMDTSTSQRPHRLQATSWEPKTNTFVYGHVCFLLRSLYSDNSILHNCNFRIPGSLCFDDLRSGYEGKGPSKSRVA